MLSITIFCFIVSFIHVQATNFTQCENKNQPLELRVLGCDEPPCKFIRSQTTIFEIDFEADRDILQLKPQVRAKAMGINTLYPLPQQNACLSIMNGECPLDKGEVVTYMLEMPILSTFPKVSFQVQFSLLSQDDTIICFKLNGMVDDP